MPHGVRRHTEKNTRMSPAQAHDAVIRNKLKQKLTSQLIYQDLVAITVTASVMTASNAMSENLKQQHQSSEKI